MAPVKADRVERTVPALIGREAEARRLRRGIELRESLLVTGAADMGKTALVMNVMDQLSNDAGKSFLYVSEVSGLHDLLQRLVRRLYESNDATLRRQLRAEGVSQSGLEGWLKAQSSSRLKGCLYRAVEDHPYWIFLDRIAALTDAVAKVVKELIHMRDTPVYLLAREFSGRERELSGRIYWHDSLRLGLKPLSRKAARKLLDGCLDRYGLSNLDWRGFREEVLHLSGQVPGAIVKMCALAAEPRYQCGRNIKTKLLRIDYLMRGSRAPWAREQAERR